MKTIFKAEYIGRCKKRSNGSESAFGWSDGKWSIIFPKDVLFLWFGMISDPTSQSNLYHVLGIKQDTPQTNIKKAYRKMAKQWHPDYCKEPNASEQFQKIHSAYEILKNSNTRAKYNAGLKLESTLSITKRNSDDEWGWRSPLRCGFILADYKPSGRWNVIQKIDQWEDIVNSNGQTLISSWVYGDNKPIMEWL